MIYHMKRYIDYINKEEKQINPDFDFLSLTDQDAEYGRYEVTYELGFYLPPSSSSLSEEQIRSILPIWEWLRFIEEPYQLY